MEGAFTFYPFDKRKDVTKMNKKILSLALVLIMAFSLLSCAKEKTDVWSDALYVSDTTLGEGDKVITVEVTADEKTIIFTVNTDSENLGDALLECGLAEGEDGPYGLYIKKVNGILADYDVDRHYWAVSKEGIDLMTGTESEIISGGEHYEIKRAK